MRPRRCPSGLRAGFSLLEVLMVGLILAVLAAVAVPELGKFAARDRAPRVAADLAYLLRYAQGRAVVSRRAMRLRVEGVPACYWLEQQALSSGVEKTGEDPRFENLSGRIARRVAIPEQVTVDPLPAVLLLHPDGSIDGGPLSLCGPERCYRLETRVQRGQVFLMDVAREHVRLQQEGESR